jgi:hypothetical protein
MYNELERISKKAVVYQSEKNKKNLAEFSEEEHESPQRGSLMSLHKFESATV